MSKEKIEKFLSRQVKFEDDLNGVGSLENLKKYWNSLEREGGKFGYYIKVLKSHIIVKAKLQDKEKQIFRGARSQ